MLNMQEASERLRRGGIVAIVRGRYAAGQILEIADVLAESGITAMEVTLNSADAPSHISALRRHAGDRLLIGAGTVRSAADVDLAVAAGAQFLISPGFDPASVMHSQAIGVLHLPGVFTPSEAMAAAAAGCRLLKLFPCDIVGPAYLKALRAPLDDIGFVPTGGVSAANAAAWRSAGAAAVAVGSSLVAGPDQPSDALLAAARAMVEAWQNAGEGAEARCGKETSHA